jgi:hypothetical protein
MPVAPMVAMRRRANFVELLASGFDCFALGLIRRAVGGTLGCVCRGELVAGGLEFLHLSWAEVVVAVHPRATHSALRSSAQRDADLPARLLGATLGARILAPAVFSTAVRERDDRHSDGRRRQAHTKQNQDSTR